MLFFFQKMSEKYCFIENCRSEYLQRNALPKSTSRDTAVGIPVDCMWRCIDHDLMCHRVVLDLIALGFSERRNPAMVAAT